jgi:Mlc titration factor MtfA (ptsG expression regulator)
MDFKSPTTRIGLPFLVLIILGIIFRESSVAIYLIILGLVGGGLLFAFRQPIHWHWYAQDPPPIAPEMIQIVASKIPFYRQLTPENKKHFLRRMSLFMMAKEIESLNEDEMLPADFRGLIAASAVQINFGKEEFLFPEFKKIIVHPGLFLSASLNRQFHGSETFIDPEYKGHSCLIFAGDRLMHAFREPKSGYNIVLHELANVFMEKNNLHHIEEKLKKDRDILKQFATIRGFNYIQILEYTKNPKMSYFGLAMEHFYYNPEKFRDVLPDLFEELMQALNQNPLNTSTPVIKPIDYQLLLEKNKIY